MLKVKFKIRNSDREFEHIEMSEEEMHAYIEENNSHWTLYEVYDVNQETGQESENYEF